ncbi:uncharacterized protein isoform X2 [Musca autumnalis]|uniref:uncharacterized protein isoform X2 n=1 Tax=Musca autumnalis TaxID=221902 RepID=UPI003CE78B95
MSSVEKTLNEMLEEIEKARKIIKDYKQKHEQLEAQKQELREKIKKQELLGKALKSKTWNFFSIV